MNKKLLCLTLSILMLLACVFTSCSTAGKTDETGEDTVDNSAKTIVMWVITENETTPEAEELVNQAFTKITKAKFKTNVVIKFCTEDEYYDKLEEAIETQQYDILMQEQAAKELRKYLKLHKGGEKSNDELTKDFYIEYPEYAKYAEVEEEEDDEDGEVTTEEETFVNEYGIAEIKYPEPKDNQVDIFYLSGYDKYMDYYNAEWLASLSEELSTSSKKLNDYISTSLLNGVQIEGGVYAIPNNVEIGEYTYMMIDKALFDKYYQKIDKVQSVLDLSTFLNDVRNDNAVMGLTAEDEGYVVPLASTYSECAKMLCWFWDLDYTDQSVYDMYYDPITTDSKGNVKGTGRYYVLKKRYEVKTEVTNADGETETKTSTVITSSVQPDVIYKTNELGQYVDKDGNALNYTYRVDKSAGFLYDDGKSMDKPTYDAAAAGAMYLVDENGDAVTPETDRRVQIDGETRMDADGNTRPTYHYSYNEADFSVLGAMMKDASQRSRGEINLGFNALFADAEFQEMYATLKDFEYQEFYGEVKDGQSAAVSFVKGDARIKLDYEEDGIYVDENGKEYYVVVAEYPEATEEELYGNMFAVYANSTYLARSMEVITYLNTNKEMRDLLQYGILDQHYELNEDGTVRLLSNEKYGIYRMDIEKTGNCFIATPPESMGIDAWTYAKSQNNDSLVNPLMGFDFNEMTADSDYSLDVALIDHIAQLNADAQEMISECTDKASLLDLLSDTESGFAYLYTSRAGDTKLDKAINPEYDPEMPLGPEVEEAQTPDKSGSSPYTIYQSWLTTYGYLYEDEAED